MIARAPTLFTAGTKIKEMVLNVDIGPAILEMAGVKRPKKMQGFSFLRLLNGQPDPNWRKEV